MPVKSPKKETVPETVSFLDSRGHDFLWMENEIIRKHLFEIGPEAFACYGVLCFIGADRTPRDFFHVCDYTGLSNQAVKTALLILHERCIIRIIDADDFRADLSIFRYKLANLKPQEKD